MGGLMITIEMHDDILLVCRKVYLSKKFTHIGCLLKINVKIVRMLLELFLMILVIYLFINVFICGSCLGCIADGCILLV